MENKNLYTEKSIESLSPLEFTRLRPGVYAGDCTYATQLLVEIIANSVDEFRLGHGNKINVNINEFFNSHFSVIGNTGSGKSSGVASILQKLFKDMTLCRIVFPLQSSTTRFKSSLT